MTKTATHALRDAIYTAVLALDPDRQGVCWPDPIAWDGRPLEEQAEDLMVLLDTTLEDMRETDPRYDQLSTARAQLQHVLDTLETA